MSDDILQKAEELDRKIKTTELDGIDRNEINLCFGLLIVEIKRLRDRCWKAKARIAELEQIAIKHLAWAKFVEAEMDAIPQGKNYEEYRAKYERVAAKELFLECRYPDPVGEELTIAYMLGGKKSDERLKVLIEYVARLEKEFLRVYFTYKYHKNQRSGKEYVEADINAEAQVALDKIREGI